MKLHAAPLCLPLLLFVPGLCLAQTNYGASVDSAGNFGNNFSYFSVISSDGRYVSYQSQSSNLVPNDGNGQYDIFRHDLMTGTTELVSLNANGSSSANGLGLSPDISGDGRYVAWSSNASNVVAGDTNGTWDVFLRDMVTGTNERLSITSAGMEANLRSDSPRITPDARYVVFESDDALVPADANGLKDVYRLDRQMGALDLVSITQAGGQGNGWSYHGDVSDDGRYVTFTSAGDNLVAGDTNGQGDMFWKDMATGELRRVNVSSAGVQANNSSMWPYISGDGMTVVFSSDGSTLVPGDTNGRADLFAVDIQAATIERLNVRPDGTQADSYAESPASLSTDGRYVLYASLSTNLVAGDTNGSQDIFLRDRLLDTTARLNLSSTGGELNSDSWVPQMTPDVRVITYTSTATNIVMGNTNNQRQIFARELSSDVGSNYCTTNVNSTGLAAAITAAGTNVFSANDLTLEASSLPAFSFAFFLASQTQGFVANPGGSQGNLCLGGFVGRYVGPGQTQNSGGAGVVTLALDLTAIPQPSGFVSAAAGETWYFQAWIRDSFLGMSTSNFTNGLAVTLQ